ncbi:MAG: cation transporter [Nevskiales bacterium]
MNTLKSILLTLLLAVPLAVTAADRTVRLSVPGMNCPVCPFTVKKSLEQLNGVTVQSVNLHSKTAVVTVRDNAITNADLTQATATAGYPSVVIPERSP